MTLRTFPMLAAAAIACSGSEPSQLVSMDLVEPGDDCPNGGIALHIGEDEDEDGVLDDTEIAETELVCNGTDGTPGEDGDDGEDGANSLIETETLPRRPSDRRRPGQRGRRGHGRRWHPPGGGDRRHRVRLRRRTRLRPGPVRPPDHARWRLHDQDVRRQRQ
ncbi:MAG: hypothetical protein JRI25_15565 [Deltaproteobacteria bacterium]|nr:hypothetical protein [Deltaproteobacteria bacterium]